MKGEGKTNDGQHSDSPTVRSATLGACASDRRVNACSERRVYACMFAPEPWEPLPPPAPGLAAAHAARVRTTTFTLHKGAELFS